MVHAAGVAVSRPAGGLNGHLSVGAPQPTTRCEYIVSYRTSVRHVCDKYVAIAPQDPGLPDDSHYARPSAPVSSATWASSGS